VLHDSGREQVWRHDGAPLSSQADQILSRVDDTLATARQGFIDLCGADKSRRMTGLRNLLVFDRSVTFVLQNLRSLNQPEFDAATGPPFQPQTATVRSAHT
jgi:hypothetical protein